MNTSLTPATTPVQLSHPGSDHIRTGYNIAITDRVFINKPDDVRNPSSEPYRDLLLKAGCSVTVHDPHVLEYPDMAISHGLSDVVKGADVVAILTGHDEYFGLDAGTLKRLMGQNSPVIVDGRNVVDADGFISEGFVYKGIGRGDKNTHSINKQT